MNKRMICTECPKGCSLAVTIQEGKVVSVRGNQCERGIHFAAQEVEDPKRLLTSTVCAKGLSIKMIPVRTDKAMPKDKLIEGMQCVQGLEITEPVTVGDVIVERFLGLDVNLIATRSVGK